MRIEHLQKVCDVYDWADDRVDAIIRNRLRTVPNFHRKQWEFALIYLALEELGKLRPDARGLAFGAGREPLIYALAERVGHLLVTDIYGADAKWIGTQTASPKDYVLSHAPFPVDASRLDACYMDMTKIDYDGPPLDFCYSSCAFEHIGKEFATFTKHLADVKRILKPGGVYVFTTELRYGETAPYPHNFFFNYQDLIDVIKASGMIMDPVLDLRLRRATLNAPSLNWAEFGAHAARMSQAITTPVRSGNMFTSVNIVLTNAESQSVVRPIGVAETMDWLTAEWRRAISVALRAWQSVNPVAGLPGGVVGHEEMTQDKPGPDNLVWHTAWLGLGDGPTDIRIYPASGGLTIRTVEADVMDRSKRRIIAEYKDADGPRDVHFTARGTKTYAVVARGHCRDPLAGSIHVRRSPTKTAAIEQTTSR